VIDTVRDAAQWEYGAVHERRAIRQTAQPGRYPRTVLLRKLPGLSYAAARRHGEHDLAARRVDAQRVPPRLSVTAHAHQIDLTVELDCDGRRLTGTAKKQSA
jgi:hypothetical protein